MESNLKSFETLIEMSKDFGLDIRLEEYQSHLKLTKHTFPWSIKESEAKIIYDSILFNNLQSGFEIATGFGISSVTIGQALKVTGGKLVTVDAYVEEAVNDCFGYDIKTEETYKDTDGFKMVNALISSLELTDEVIPVVGWSPRDINYIITNNTESSKFDFFFIDGGHTDSQVLADTEVLLPYMKEDCLLIYHDFTPDVKENLYQNINLEDLGFTFKQYNTPFSLCMYSRGVVKLT